MFVTLLEPGVFTAIWQGEAENAGDYVDVTGSRHEVVEWLSRCRARVFMAFVPERDEYVAFAANPGHVDLPI
ncbi:hypothetical protein [Paractinoplanes brasiliensis]|uniref:hypothetical protein n=1 Tax=Paractinoplanes brasiliensis TaxID=52695 RepID=UPI0010604523|nr:hypothetical protein [Actinoplanes brasiliensis]